MEAGGLEIKGLFFFSLHREERRKELGTRVFKSVVDSEAHVSAQEHHTTQKQKTVNSMDMFYHNGNRANKTLSAHVYTKSRGAHTPHGWDCHEEGVNANTFRCRSLLLSLPGSRLFAPVKGDLELSAPQTSSGTHTHLF